MPKTLKTPAKLDLLALHIASGGCATAWAKEHGVSIRATYAWCGLPEVQDRVSVIRGRLIDQAVGKLASTARKAAAELDRLIEAGSTDNVRLAAARGALSDMMGLSDFASLERRITALEQGRGHAIIERSDEPHPEA